MELRSFNSVRQVALYIRRLHSDEVEMQISTLVQRFILVFVRYLFPYELSFTSCEFGIVTWVK